MLSVVLLRALKLSLGSQLAGIDFVKRRRDALRSLFGSTLEHEFLEDRRLQLDSFVSRLCELTSAVDFFKHHADPNLKTFFNFDDNCQSAVRSLDCQTGSLSARAHLRIAICAEQDESPHKAKGGWNPKDNKASRRSGRNGSDGNSGRQSMSSSRASDVSRVSESRSESVEPPSSAHDRANKSSAKSSDERKSSGSDKRERHASKKKDRKTQKAELSAGRERTGVRSASPTSTH